MICTLVKVWDAVGEDQTLKGEYKVVSGRVYVLSTNLMLTSTLITYLVMISPGTVKVSESLPSGTEETGMYLMFVWRAC